MFTFLLILAGAFAVRAIPRSAVPNAFASDSNYHLFCAEEIRKGGLRIPKQLPKVVIGNEYTYPPLYHFLLACFTGKARIRFERLTGAIFDTLSVAIVYGASVKLFAERGYSFAYGPELVAALFAFSPAFLRLGSGPRAYNGNARVPGQLFYLIHMIAAAEYLAAPRIDTLVLSILAGVLVIFTSKFSCQSMFFFTPFIALFVSMDYLAILGGAIALSMAVSPSVAWRILRGGVLHSMYYYKHFQTIYLHPHAVTWQQYKQRLRSCREGLKNCEWYRVRDWFYDERFFGHLLLFSFPQFLIVPFLLVMLPAMPVAEKFLWAWSAGALFCFFATKTKPLMFLGEGERYLEAGVFPTLFLLLAYSGSGAPVVGALLLSYSLASTAYFMAAFVARHRPLNDDYQRGVEVFARLNDLPPGTIMPIGWAHWQSCLHGRFPVLTASGNFLTDQVVDDFRFVFGCDPYPSPNLSAIVERFNVSYLVAERSCLEHYLGKIVPDAKAVLGDMHLVAQSGQILAFVMRRTLQQLVNKAEQAAMSGNLAESELHLLDLVKFGLKDSAIHEALGSVRFRQGNFEGAVEQLREARLLSPDLAPAWIAEAESCVRLGRIAEAKEVLGELLKRQPSHPEASVLLHRLSSMDSVPFGAGAERQP